MLIVVQFAFADLRPFSSTTNSRTSKPNWSMSDFKGFVRGFGEVQSRFKRFRNPHMRNLYKSEKIEKHYVDATRRIYPLLNIAKKPPVVDKCFHIYTRLIADGKFSFRIEIGFHVEIKGKLTNLEYQSILEYILYSHITFRNRNREKSKSYSNTEVGTILNSAAKFRTRIKDKTSLHGSTIVSIKNTDFIDILGLMIFVDFEDNNIDASILKENQLTSSINNLNIVFFEKYFNATPATIWSISNKNSSSTESLKDTLNDQRRRIKLHICRISAEIRALEVALFSASTGLLEINSNPIKMELFEQVVRETLDRLIETSKVISRDLGVFEMAKSINSEAMSEIIDNIQMHFDRIAFSQPPSNQRRMREFKDLVRCFPITINTYNYLDITKGNKTVKKIIKGDQMIASNGAINAKNLINSQVSTSSTITEIDPKNEIDIEALIEELKLLRQSASSNTNTLKENEQLLLLQKAEEAGANGDKNEMFEHLQNTGAWLLDVAKKIGIPIAIAVLTKLTN